MCNIQSSHNNTVYSKRVHISFNERVPPVPSAEAGEAAGDRLPYQLVHGPVFWLGGLPRATVYILTAAGTRPARTYST